MATVHNIAQSPNHKGNDIAFNIGARLDNGKPISHSMFAAANFNHAFIGTSGVGKTYGIQKFSLEFNRQGCTVFIIDTQGDFNPAEYQEKHDISGVDFHVMEFGYDPECYGINPFVINANEKGGGMYHAEINVLETVRLFNGSLGSRQKTVLKKLIEETFNEAGIYRDLPETYSLTPPTLDDLYALLQTKIKMLQTGIDKNIFEKIGSVKKEIAKNSLALKKERLKNDDPHSSSSQKIEDFESVGSDLIDELKTLVAEMAEKEVYVMLDQGSEEAVLKSEGGGSLERLTAIDDLLSGMIQSRLFAGPNVAAKSNRINVLDLSGVNAAQQPALFHLLLDRIFQASIRGCTKLNPEKPSFMFGFDEAKVFTSFASSPLSPINRIYTEGRKYGLGTFTGLQTPAQLTDEIRSCLSTILLYPLARDRYKDAKRLWGISEVQMDSMRPKSDAMYSLNSTDFIPMKMFA